MIYLDNAATTFPKPKEVYKASDDCMRFCGNPGRGGHILSLRTAETVYETRCRICEFFHTDLPENVIFVPNATYALNLALRAFFQKNTRILISNMEHNAVFRPVSSLYGRDRIGFFSPYGDVETSLDEAATPDTHTVVCTQASNVTGRPTELHRIGEWCRKRKIRLVIDGAQGAGHLKTDLSRQYYSAYCCSGHKGLYGLQGSGFCIFSEMPENEFLQGGTGSLSLSAEMPPFLPDRYEPGTLPCPSIASLKAGIQWLKEHYLEWEQDTEILRKRFAENLASLPGIRVINESDGGCGIVSFVSAVPELTESLLGEKGVCVRGGFHCAPLAHKTLGTAGSGCIRCSLGFFSTKRETDKAVKIISEVCRQAR